MSKARIAIIPGDPSGIGPELIAKLVNDEGVRDAADILLVGDSHLWRQGGSQADLKIPLNGLEKSELDGWSGLGHIEMDTISTDDVRIAEVTEAGGRSSLRCLDAALDLARDGHVDSVLFGPFNKSSMTLAGLDFEDEHRYIANYLDFNDYHCEINVLDDLMTVRCTSHIALQDVAKNISADGVYDAVNLIHNTMQQAGIENPSIAVAALNPHAGDNGKFGREEIDILEPAVAECQKRGFNVTGPWPSDTVFLKAQAGEVDAVVTMYHDQGQIAIKLLGFHRGVTLAGGLPIPVATPAHGTAFDIAGKREANLGAMRQAFNLLVRMSTQH